MSNQLPMAINPSKTSKEHVMTNLLNCFTFVDTEKQLVIAYPIFLHLGYTRESVQAALSKPMFRQHTNCKGFAPREDFFISIPQIGELIVSAPEAKYIPHILEFIKNTLTPLFNTQPQKHDDFKKEIDMNLITTNQPLTMSSQEMADLTETRHDSVKRTMETLQNKGIISFTQTVENPDNKGGRPKTVYNVNKRDSYVVVAQLSPEFTARLVDRWQELENGVVPQLGYDNALKLLGVAEQIVPVIAKVYEERDEAVKTKGQIRDKQLASAMGTAGALANKMKALEAKVGIIDTVKSKAVEFATILAIQSRVENLKASGLKLANYCRQKGLEIHAIPDERYGKIQSYPAQAWKDVYDININQILGG
jgi:phage regulator Rha-like protein